MTHTITDQYGRLLDSNILEAAKGMISKGQDSLKTDNFTLSILRDKRCDNYRETAVRVETVFTG